MPKEHVWKELGDRTLAGNPAGSQGYPRVLWMKAFGKSRITHHTNRHQRRYPGARPRRQDAVRAAQGAARLQWPSKASENKDPAVLIAHSTSGAIRRLHLQSGSPQNSLRLVEQSLCQTIMRRFPAIIVFSPAQFHGKQEPHIHLLQFSGGPAPRIVDRPFVQRYIIR
jgi:hypothetical protein